MNEKETPLTYKWKYKSNFPLDIYLVICTWCSCSWHAKLENESEVCFWMRRIVLLKIVSASISMNCWNISKYITRIINYQTYGRYDPRKIFLILVNAFLHIFIVVMPSCYCFFCSSRPQGRLKIHVISYFTISLRH